PRHFHAAVPRRVARDEHAHRDGCPGHAGRGTFGVWLHVLAIVPRRFEAPPKFPCGRAPRLTEKEPVPGASRCQIPRHWVRAVSLRKHSRARWCPFASWRFVRDTTASVRNCVSSHRTAARACTG